jgi:hypothetical protein
MTPSRLSLFTNGIMALERADNDDRAGSGLNTADSGSG